MTHESVKGDYIQAIMQMGDSYLFLEAKKYVEDQGDISFWWYEQMLPYPDIVMEKGVLVKDITEEEKEDVLTSLASRGWMEEIE